MKHLKKLSVVLMLTALFSVTFTSCIDNEVSPVVEAIYEAQADLIAAQAGVQNAEAAYLLAQAEAEQAQAAWNTAQAAQVDAITAGIEETNSYNALKNDQAILLLVAQTNRDVAAAENAMALAQVTFEAALQTAIAAMEAAGAQIAVNYAYQYAGAMTAANNIWASLLTAQANLADAQLMVTGVSGSEVSYAFHLAGLENAVALQVANIAASEAALALLESSTPTAAKEALDAQKVSLQSQYDALLQTEEAQLQAIAAINFQDLNRDAYVTALTSALNDHNLSIGTRITRENSIIAAQELIDGYEDAILDYAGTTTTLTTAVTDATDAVNAAILALGDGAVYDDYYTEDANGDGIAAGGVKYAAPANLQEVLVNAAIDKADAALALSTLVGQITSLYGSLQAAAGTLATQQGIYDLGIAGVTSTNITAATAVTDAQTALATAQSNYATWKTVFEANPAGLTWFEETSILGTTTLGADSYDNAFIGNHSDGIATSYRRVLTWSEIPAASGDFFPATYATASVATIPVDVVGPPAVDNEEFLGAPLATATPTVVYYVEVESDDVSETNVAIFNAMVTALGDEDIFDVAPALPANYPTIAATYLVGSDAWTNLWNAQLYKLETQYALDNYGTALADAELAYETLRDIYENELDLLNTAQSDNSLAVSAYNTAADNVDEAWVALGQNFSEGEAGDSKRLPGDAVPTTSLTLNEVEYNAEIDLANHLDTTVAEYEAMIVTQEGYIAQWTEQITNIQVFIDAKYAVVAGLLAELDTVGIEYTFVVDEDGKGTFNVTNDTVLGSTYSDLRAQLIAANQVLWTIQRDMAAVVSEQGIVNNLISQWNTSYSTFVSTTIPNLKLSITASELLLAKAQAALALALNDEAAAEANIDYLEALVATLEQRYLNALSIAEEYKMLMEAALAS